MKNKKGLFFTISALFLVLSLIAIAAVSTETTKIEADLAVERAYELSDSVEDSIIEIFYDFSDFKAYVIEGNNTTDVKFTDKLTKKENWNEQFLVIMNNFKSFVESEDENIKINMSDIENKRITSTIIPHNISYSKDFSIGIVSIIITPEQINFGSYEVLIDAKNEEIQDIKDQIHTGPYDFLFTVTLINDAGYNQTFGGYVDIYDRHSFSVHFETTKVDVDLNKPPIPVTTGELEIKTTEPYPLPIEIIVDELVQYEEKVKIRIFDSIINVAFANLDVYKISDVTID